MNKDKKYKVARIHKESGEVLIGCRMTEEESLTIAGRHYNQRGIMGGGFYEYYVCEVPDSEERQGYKISKIYGKYYPQGKQEE